MVCLHSAKLRVGIHACWSPGFSRLKPGLQLVTVACLRLAAASPRVIVRQRRDSSEGGPSLSAAKGVACGLARPLVPQGAPPRPFPLVDNLRRLRLGLKGEPWARWTDRDCIATQFPRALPWAGRTAPLRGRDGLAGGTLEYSRHEPSLEWCAAQAWSPPWEDADPSANASVTACLSLLIVARRSAS